MNERGDVLAQLTLRWDRVRAAPLSDVHVNFDAYRRFVSERTEFADALAMLGALRARAKVHLDLLLQQGDGWERPSFATDAEEAAFGWHLVERFALSAPGANFAGTVGAYGRKLYGGEIAPGAQRGVEALIGPTQQFLTEQVWVGRAVLHSFERFAKWTRWFGHSEMQACLDAVRRDTEKKKKDWEHSLCRKAVEWTFRDGLAISDIDQQPSASRGKIDFVVTVPGGPRAVVEAKLFGSFGSPYTHRSLASGIRQLSSYLNDRGGQGFLLVFHNHPQELEFRGGAVSRARGANNTTWLRMPDGREIGIVVARLRETFEPSKMPPPIVITEDQLLSGTEGDEEP
jgi:hypothetical protein